MTPIHAKTRETTLTKRQLKLVRFIAEFSDEHGYPPTYRQMMKFMEIATCNSILCHLKALRRKGVLTWADNKARTVRLNQLIPILGEVG